MSTGRSIFIKAAGDGNLTEVKNFAGSTFKELQDFVSSEKLDVNLTDNVRCVLRSNGNDLVADEAMIPMTDGEVIFVTVDKMDGGSEYSDLKDQAKAIIARDGDAAKAHFGKFHMLGKAKLKKAIKKYNKKNPQTENVEVAVEEEVVVAESTVETTEEVSEETVDALEGTIATSPEMEAARAAYADMTDATGKMLTALDGLAKIAFPTSEPIIGGVSLSALEAEFASHQEVTASLRG